MSEASIVTIIIGVLGLLGGGGFWGYKQFSKEAPVKKRDADIAVAEKSQQMALKVAEESRNDVKRLRDELNAEREARHTLTGRVDSLEGQVREANRTIQTLREAIRLFHAAWDDLTHRWHVVRQSEQPPTRPHVTTD